MSRKGNRVALLAVDSASIGSVNGHSGRTPPNQQEIQALAYELFQRREREGTPGDDLSDWREAERLLQQRATPVTRHPNGALDKIAEAPERGSRSAETGVTRDSASVQAG